MIQTKQMALCKNRWSWQKINLWPFLNKQWCHDCCDHHVEWCIDASMHMMTMIIANLSIQLVDSCTMLSLTQSVVEQKRFSDGRATWAARKWKICNCACKWMPRGHGSFTMAVDAFIHMYDNGRLIMALPEALCQSLCWFGREKIQQSTWHWWHIQPVKWSRTLPGVPVGIHWFTQFESMPLAFGKKAFGSCQCHEAVLYLATSSSPHSLTKAMQSQHPERLWWWQSLWWSKSLWRLPMPWGNTSCNQHHLTQQTFFGGSQKAFGGCKAFGSRQCHEAIFTLLQVALGILWLEQCKGLACTTGITHCIPWKKNKQST